MIGLVLTAGVLLSLVGLANRPAITGPVGRAGARRSAICLAGAVLLVYIGLMLLAAPAILTALHGPALSTACRRLLEPAGAGVSTLAAGVLAGSGYAATLRVGKWRRDLRALRIEPWIGQHAHHSAFDLVTLSTTAPIAYSVAGDAPQVVISTGLRDRLGPAGLAAAIAHEAAHVRGRHHRWLRFAAAAEAALWMLPWTIQAANMLRLWVERAADEDALRAVGPEALRGALLAAVDVEPPPFGAAGLSGAGVIAERISMLDDLHGRRYGAFAVMIATAGLAGPALLLALKVVGHLCPT